MTSSKDLTSSDVESVLSVGSEPAPVHPILESKSQCSELESSCSDDDALDLSG